jgi:hypothetical protein
MGLRRLRALSLNLPKDSATVRHIQARQVSDDHIIPESPEARPRRIATVEEMQEFVAARQKRRAKRAAGD